ncbi:hypothetical protein Dimus_008600 [Dionaea muscipula]
MAEIPEKSTPFIPSDMPVLDEIPLAVDRRFQRAPVLPTDSEKTETDDEIEIVEVRKGKPMASRRSNRVASQGPRKNSEEKESVKRTENVKAKESVKKKVEEKVSVSDHKEPRSKKKHDKDAGEDELLSEMLKKAKMTKKAAEECEKLRQQAKRKGDSRGVDPSAEKKQKTKKGKEEKRKEKEVYFDSSDSDDEGLMVKALPIDVIWKKRVIRSKIVREGWMSDNGLNNVMELIKRQKWENLFKKRLLVHVDAVKEFYAKMTVIHLKKKDVVKSSVKGISIEFDHERLAAILDVPGRTGICEYIKEVWEESRYTKPLEITRRFANDATIMKARRVQSVEMKPSQRFIHFLVMKNVIPRFGKRDTSSFLDLTYMDHLMARRLVNPPRVMMRHMSYVISMKDHELPYGDWLTLVFEAFGVPLVIKKGEEPKKYDFFKDTFLTIGENRRRDDDEATPEEEAEGDDEGNKDDFDREAIIDEATAEGESGRRADDETPSRLASPSFIFDSAKDQELAGVDPRVLQREMLEFRSSSAEFERKGPTGFMMNWRRPKLRMPNF